MYEYGSRQRICNHKHCLYTAIRELTMFMANKIKESPDGKKHYKNSNVISEAVQLTDSMQQSPS
jgi:hypothetical protein